MAFDGMLSLRGLLSLKLRYNLKMGAEAHTSESASPNRFPPKRLYQR